jgi:hypothetical protein
LYFSTSKLDVFSRFLTKPRISQRLRFRGRPRQIPKALGEGFRDLPCSPSESKPLRNGVPTKTTYCSTICLLPSGVNPYKAIRTWAALPSHTHTQTHSRRVDVSVVSTSRHFDVPSFSHNAQRTWARMHTTNTCMCNYTRMHTNARMHTTARILHALPIHTHNIACTHK